MSRRLANYHDSKHLPSRATAILRPSLPLRWSCGWLSSFSLPRYPNRWRLGPTNGPLHPTSTGKHLALHPACWRSLTGPAYSEGFLSKASSIRWPDVPDFKAVPGNVPDFDIEWGGKKVARRLKHQLSRYPVKLTCWRYQEAPDAAAACAADFCFGGCTTIIFSLEAYGKKELRPATALNGMLCMNLFILCGRNHGDVTHLFWSLKFGILVVALFFGARSDCERLDL